jgi:hypothetical protein
MAKAKSKAKRDRHERRFYPHSATNPKLVAIAGALGALLAGAGAYGQFGPMHEGEWLKIVPWLLAAGAALIGGAFWFGTSGEPTLRVGDGGIAVEKGSVPRRMPWFAVEAITFDHGAGAVVAKGNDEAGAAMTVTAKLASQPLAAAWIVKEAKERVGSVVDVDEGASEHLPATQESDGEVLKLEPVQVVGMHCAASGKVISFEPDARVCHRCERVYHKNHVPKKCACGASLASPKSKDDDEDAA